jgi:LPPG:FO 2-phospho-L-lactate transferase
MIVLSGGTGTPKLLLGLKELLPEPELNVVANTAEDIWISGNLVSPDLDTVLYTLAGVVDQERWWGLQDDTFHTHRFLEKLGRKELLQLGDRDRAIHIYRSELLRGGASLSRATADLAGALGIAQRVVPMSDDPITTLISTPQGEMHFQEFWVGHRGRVEILSVRFRGIDDALPSQGFLELLEREETVLLGPSNPVTSLGPILALHGVRERLIEKKVVAVSPLVGDKPVSGPAAELMRARGVPASDQGVAKLLGKVDLFVVDSRSSYREECLRLDTLMRCKDDSLKLAGRIVEMISCS